MDDGIERTDKVDAFYQRLCRYPSIPSITEPLRFSTHTQGGETRFGNLRPGFFFALGIIPPPISPPPCTNRPDSTEFLFNLE